MSVCLMGILFSCGDTDDAPDENTAPGENVAPGVSVPTPLSPEYGTGLVSKAVQKSFHAHYAQAVQKSFHAHYAQAARVRPVAIKADDAIHYPYDAIMVGKIFRCTADTFSAPSFDKITELYMADFGVTGPDINIGENLLIIKYAGGEYSCLLNGGSLSEEVFSSHKQLTDSAIVKEFTYPYYNFFVRHNGSKDYYLGVTVKLSPEDTWKDRPEEWFPLNDPDEVDANDVYSLDELLGSPSS
ncbi:MAG: hypothetical protein LBL94_04700 [Prevotellaceae bacterium]|nr:hypothetical protein [Prevotellaceae bacterium]